MEVGWNEETTARFLLSYLIIVWFVVRTQFVTVTADASFTFVFAQVHRLGFSAKLGVMGMEVLVASWNEKCAVIMTRQGLLSRSAYQARVAVQSKSEREK